jgi:methionyl-tRNA formyltransferase
MALRVVFLGTPEIAVPTLRALAVAGHEVPCVYTQPPRPAGRGHREQSSPVARSAVGLGVPVRTPASLKPKEVQEEFARLNADVGVVVAYGQILPPAILRAPRLGCVNLHASLLPRWRGAAPIVHAVLAGDRRHGFSVMQMDENLDTGPVLYEEEVDSGPRPTAGILHDAIADRGAAAMVRVLDDLADGILRPKPQPTDGATYAHKITPEDARLDWTRTSAELDRTVRALSPRPGAWFESGGERVRVLAAEPAAGSGEPGTVLDHALTVACGDGALRILKVQRAGKRPMLAAEWLRGFAMPKGKQLGGAD